MPEFVQGGVSHIAPQRARCCNAVGWLLVHGPRYYFGRAHHTALTGDANACVIRQLISDHYAKPVSRISTELEKLGFRHDARDSLAETASLPALRELSSSLYGDS